MATFILTYSLNIDFPNKKADPDRLSADIASAGCPNAVSGVLVIGDAVKISLSGNYSTEAEQAVNSAVSSHSGEPVRTVDTVELIEDRTFTTAGSFQGCMWEWDIPAGPPGVETVLTAAQETNSNPVSFPFPVSMLMASWLCNETHNGDEGRFVAGLNSPVGVMTAGATTGDKVLAVTDTVPANVYPGIVVVAGNVPLGRCVAVDKVENTITVENAAPGDIPAGTPILATKEIARKIYFEDGHGCRFQFGTKRVGGSLVPAGVECNLIYKNNNGEAKKFRIHVEYMM